MVINSSTFASCLYLNHINRFAFTTKSITSTMASKTVVHNPSSDNTVFQLEDKSIILTTCDEGMAYGGDVVVIFTDRDLPVESASQEDGPRIIYANRHAVQDSNGEVRGLNCGPDVTFRPF